MRREWAAHPTTARESCLQDFPPRHSEKRKGIKFVGENGDRGRLQQLGEVVAAARIPYLLPVFRTEIGFGDLVSEFFSSGPQLWPRGLLFTGSMSSDNAPSTRPTVGSPTTRNGAQRIFAD